MILQLSECQAYEFPFNNETRCQEENPLPQETPRKIQLRQCFRTPTHTNTPIGAAREPSTISPYLGHKLFKGRQSFSSVSASSCDRDIPQRGCDANLPCTCRTALPPSPPRPRICTPAAHTRTPSGASPAGSTTHAPIGTAMLPAHPLRKCQAAPVPSRAEPQNMHNQVPNHMLMPAHVCMSVYESPADDRPGSQGPCIEPDKRFMPAHIESSMLNTMLMRQNRTNPQSQQVTSAASTELAQWDAGDMQDMLLYDQRA